MISAAAKLIRINLVLTFKMQNNTQHQVHKIKKVAILGGSFDPPTISHLQVSPPV